MNNLTIRMIQSIGHKPTFTLLIVRFILHRLSIFVFSYSISWVVGLALYGLYSALVKQLYAQWVDVIFMIPAFGFIFGMVSFAVIVIGGLIISEQYDKFTEHYPAQKDKE